MNRTRSAEVSLVVAALASVVVTIVPLVVPSSSAVSCSVTVQLRPGDVGPGVNCLEQRLIELGNTGIVGPDDTYDTASVNAVKSFQLSRGMFDDGIVTSIVGRQMGLRGTLDRSTAATVTVIGDSTSAAMRWYDEAGNNTVRYDVMAQDYNTIWSLESCRRLVATSCVGRYDPITGVRSTPVSVLPLMQTTLKGQLGEALVIMAGYDDTSIVSAIESIMTEAKAQGVSKVLWLNYRQTPGGYAYTPYYAAHNAALANAKVRHPNLIVLDWDGYTSSQPSSVLSSWFASDQIHITGAGALALSNYLTERLGAEHIEVCATPNALAGVPAGATGVPAPTPIPDSGFVGIQPVRVLDTRNSSIGGGVGKTRADSVTQIDLDGVLPAGTNQAVLNVTAVNPCSAGFLTAYDCGTRPDTSNVNYEAGRTTAALAMSLLASDDGVCIYSFAKTDLVVDLIGAFTDDGDAFHALGPVRWVDTRGNAAVHAAAGPFTVGGSIDVPIAGVGGVPADAMAVWINLTATGSPVGTVWQAYPGPCSGAPNSSTVNLFAGRSAATSTLVDLGANGGICIQVVQGSGHAVVDVSGWFGGASAGGLLLRSAPPVRVIDTRSGARPAANTIVSLPATEVGVYNTTAVESAAFGFVTATPCGSSSVSSLVNTAPQREHRQPGSHRTRCGRQGLLRRECCLAFCCRPTRHVRFCHLGKSHRVAIAAHEAFLTQRRQQSFGGGVQHQTARFRRRHRPVVECLEQSAASLPFAALET